MTALVAIVVLVVVLLGVLVAGLLRSHAEVLRALHSMGIDLGHGSAPPAPTAAMPVTLSRRPTPARPPSSAIPDVVGVSPSGDSRRVAVGAVAHDTLLTFLTTGCSTCRGFWDVFRTRTPVVPGGARLVVVTRGPEAESPSTVGSLAGDQVTVVMSSEAWEAYDIPAAPYVVYVSGAAGKVMGEGAAAGWEQVVSLLDQAVADGTTTAPSVPMAPGGADAVSAELRAAAAGWAKARADAEREARIDAELAEVGILPGDERLYPSRMVEGQPKAPQS